MISSYSKGRLSHTFDKTSFASEHSLQFDRVNKVMRQAKFRRAKVGNMVVGMVDKAKEASQFGTTHEAKKLMHRFKEHEVEKLMDEAMMDAPSSSSTSA